MSSFYSAFQERNANPVKLIELLQQLASGHPFDEEPVAIFYFLMENPSDHEGVAYWGRQCVEKIRTIEEFSRFRTQMIPILKKAESRTPLDPAECRLLLPLPTRKFEQILLFTLENSLEPSTQELLLAELNLLFPSEALADKSAIYLESPSDSVVHLAVAGLKANATTKAVHHLIRFHANNFSMNHQEYALRALESLDRTTLERSLLTLCQSPVEGDRGAAFHLIATLGIARCVSILHQLIDHQKALREILQLFIREGAPEELTRKLIALKANFPALENEFTTLERGREPHTQEATPTPEQTPVTPVGEARSDLLGNVQSVTANLKNTLSQWVQQTNRDGILETGKRAIQKGAQLTALKMDRDRILNEKLNPAYAKIGGIIYDFNKDNPRKHAEGELLFAIMETRFKLKEARDAMEKSSGGGKSLFSGFLGLNSEQDKLNSAEGKRVKNFEKRIFEQESQLGKKMFPTFNQAQVEALGLRKEYALVVESIAELEETDQQIKRVETEGPIDQIENS